MNGRRDEFGGDDGMVLVVVAVVVSALLVFAALVIDTGLLSRARRGDQTAADLAAMAAAQDLGDDAATIATVKSVVNLNLPDPLTDAQWNSCGTTHVPTGFAAAPGADCISWNDVRTYLRVELPNQQLDATFGSVAGQTSYDHSAFAIAAMRSKGLGGVLPFAVNQDSGTYVCLKVGAGNVPDPSCSGSNSGNFGMLNFAFHGNVDLGTSPDCTGGGNGRLANNLAVGIDHDLSTYGGSPWGFNPVVDAASCGLVPRPNSTYTFTGNVPNVVGAGLYSGSGYSDGGPARLARYTADLTWGRTTRLGGVVVDDNPLWGFIPTTIAGSVPDSCRRDQFVDPASGDVGTLTNLRSGNVTAIAGIQAHLNAMSIGDRMVKLLERCFDHYRGADWDDGGAIVPADPTDCVATGCTDPVFSLNSTIENQDLYDIQYTARFGYVPETTSSVDLTGNTQVHFGRFRAVFLQRVFAGNCNTNGCDAIFDPGHDLDDTQSITKANALTAFVFPDTMLPGKLGSEEGPTALGTNRFIELVR